MQVCGLKWSPDGSTLASGGNENFLCLWDANMSGAGGSGIAGRAGNSNRTSRDYKPRKTLVEHQAAVKALAWCPFQRHLLGSGGGTADRTIKVCSPLSDDVNHHLRRRPSVLQEKELYLTREPSLLLLHAASHEMVLARPRVPGSRRLSRLKEWQRATSWLLSFLLSYVAMVFFKPSNPGVPTKEENDGYMRDGILLATPEFWSQFRCVLGMVLQIVGRRRPRARLM